MFSEHTRTTCVSATLHVTLRQQRRERSGDGVIEGSVNGEEQGEYASGTDESSQVTPSVQPGFSSSLYDEHHCLTRLGRDLIPSQALLIVTTKAHVEEWATYIRATPWPRLLLYTDTLAKRRKMGAHNISQFDVVITTFDVSVYSNLNN